MAKPHSISGSAKSSSVTPLKAEWFDALEASHVTDEVPENWFSTSQLTEILGVGQRQALDSAKKLVEVGKAESKDFRIAKGNGTRVVTHYRLVRK